MAQGTAPELLPPSRTPSHTHQYSLPAAPAAVAFHAAAAVAAAAEYSGVKANSLFAAPGPDWGAQQQVVALRRSLGPALGESSTQTSVFLHLCASMMHNQDCRASKNTV
eukprot:scaffold23039_cov20-Tisochrysis_lutea.AAC.2